MRWSPRSWRRMRAAVARVIRAFTPPHPVAVRRVDEGEEGLLGIRGAGALEQLRERGVAEDTALAQQEQAVAAHRLVHDVARDEHRAPVGGEASEQVPQVAPQHGVEPDRRLVEHEHLGVADEGAREVRARLLPATEVLDPRVGVVGEVDRRDGPVDRVGADPHDLRDVGDVVAHRQVAVDARRLGEVPDPVTQGRRPGLLTEHRHGAPGDDLHPHDRPHEGRLASPARPQQPDDLAAGHTHAEAGQHLALPAHDPEVLDDDRVVRGFIRHVMKYATRGPRRTRPPAAEER